MAEIEEYVRLSLPELQAEEQKLRKQRTLTAALIGFFVGVAVFAAVRGKGWPTLGLVFFAWLIGRGFNQKLTAVRAELARRQAGDPAGATN